MYDPWFPLFSLAKNCSILVLDKLTLWNLFGLDFEVVVRSLVVPSSLEKQQQEVRNAVEVEVHSSWIYDGVRPREETSKQE